MDEYATQYAKEHKITLEAAHQMLRESDLAIDFTRDHAGDPGFGAAWIDATDYKLKVRSSDQSFETKISDLDALAGRVVDRQYGGAPWSALSSLPETIHAAGLDGEVSYRLNVVDGFVDVWRGFDLVQEYVDSKWIRRVVPPEVKMTLLAASSGSAVSYNQPGGPTYGMAYCTAGFTYKQSGGVSGFVTAGHCVDWNAYVDGFYSASPTPVDQRCNWQGDYAAVNFQYSPTPLNTFLNKQQNPVANWNFWVAGGVGAGQPTFKIGLDGTANRTNTGNLSSNPWQNVQVYDPATCNPGGTYVGLWATNDGMQGDSGGPLFLAYNGQWYLGGTVSVGINQKPGTNPPVFQDTGYMWVNWIPLPAGTHICNAGNPC